MSDSTLTISEFLLARIAEDESQANVAAEQPRTFAFRNMGGGTDTLTLTLDGVFDPARVLAECEAKRMLVAEAHSLDITGRGAASRRILWHLAAVYSDHPDYRDEWKP